MRIIQIHNLYRRRGGEDRVFEDTTELLRRRGHPVCVLTRDSRDLPAGPLGGAVAFGAGVHCAPAYRDAERLIARFRPDLAHVHNLHPLLSPAVLTACRRNGVPVVMTCHNYRLVCPVGTLFSKGTVCERCTDGREWQCVLRNCRGDALESAAYALRAWAARRQRVFRHCVATFVAPTRFVRDKLVEHGLPAARFQVVPHAVRAAERPTDCADGAYVAYAGRIEPEKGLGTLLAAARLCPQVPMRIAGAGAWADRLRAAAPPNVRFLGGLSRSQVESLMERARFVVVPSLWYEVFGLAAAEAMGRGLPVVASRIGGLPEVVDDGATGLLCEPGDPHALAQTVRRLWDDPELCRRMGRAGRRKVLREYSPHVHYARLLSVYRRAVEAEPGASARRAAI